MSQVVAAPNALNESVAKLLQLAGLSSPIISLTPYFNGRNNRTYRLKTSNELFVVKQYLKQEGDKRDRLYTEFAFLSYAYQVAPEFVAKPYCQDPSTGMALYEFIDGLPLKANELVKEDVDQAITFFCALNTTHARARAIPLPMASEACFTIQAHFDLITSRIKQLETIVPISAEDQAAMQLIKKLGQTWQLLIEKLSHEARVVGIDLLETLDMSQRCISPSDFGYHNALKLADGRVKFLDFEYAGWDDPAKMTGDFFAQLAVPVPDDYFNEFVRATMQPFSQSNLLAQRAQLLKHVYKVKWCCIALNIFLPVHQARYQFANHALDIVEFKRHQLVKVNGLLEVLEERK